MYAWLVVNGFLKLNKFDEINNWLIKAAKAKDIEIDLVQNTKLVGVDLFSSHKRPDFIIFWDKDIRLAKRLENAGIRLFNCASAIEKCDNKALTYITLENSNIKMPKTLIAPMTFTGIGYSDLTFLEKVEQELTYPMIIKEAFGSFGAQVYLANNRTEVEEILNKINGRPVLFQEYINSSTGKDIRINVVGDKVVATMLRTNPNDFRANISNGGYMQKYTPTKEQINMALTTCKLLNLDFAGVDILFGKDNEPILCEVNSNPHFKSIYECTKVNVAEKIIEYITNNI